METVDFKHHHTPKLDSSSFVDDGIYVLSDDEGLIDSQAVLDLQLELSVLRRRLRSTELAYRALEDGFVQLKTSNNLCLVLVHDIDFATSRYADSLEGGVLAAQHLVELVRQHIDEQDADNSQPCRILTLYTPSDKRSRDFVQGFGSVKDTLVIESGGLDKLQSMMSLLLPLPQVRKVYVTFSPQSISKLVLPYIISAIGAAHDIPPIGSSSTGNPTSTTNALSNSSPAMRHRRSFTSASSLSTISRTGSIASSDNLIPKIVLLHAGAEDTRCRGAIKELKADTVRHYASNDAVLRDLAETDFETLLHKIDCSTLFEQQIEPQEPHISNVPEITKPSPPALEPVLEVPDSPELEAEIPALPPVVTEKENMWAEVVRRGRPKEASSASPTVSKAVLPSATGGKAGSAPSSPALSVSTNNAAGNNEPSISPTRARRARGGSRKKEEGPNERVELDPTVSLCRQKKPPCNQHYLTSKGCTNPKCIYSHSYKLNARQIEELRLGALKTPCVFRKNGQVCAGSEECVFGHKCPQGSRCKQNKCHFPSHMH